MRKQIFKRKRKRVKEKIVQMKLLMKVKRGEEDKREGKKRQTKRKKEGGSEEEMKDRKGYKIEKGEIKK